MNISKFNKSILVGTAALILVSCGEGEAPLIIDPNIENEAKIDEIFKDWDNTNSPGCLAFAVQDGETILNKSYGMADLEWEQPIDENTVFYIASTTKQFTAASIALLILDRKLSLEDDIRDYIPELPDFSTPIKVKNLIYHTSGLRDYLTLNFIQGDSSGRGNNQDALNLLSKQIDLNFEPGTSWDYSNSGYVLLAILVERISGQSLDDFARENIFTPLGMENTHFDDNHKKVVKKRARSYSKTETGEWESFPKLIEGTGDGNMHTTVGDLLKWDSNFYDPIVGDERFLSFIQRPRAPIGDQNISYAFGLFVGQSYRGVPIVHHGGAFYGFRVQLTRFPDQQFSSGVLCNRADADSSDLAFKIADIYLDDTLTPIQPKSTSNAHSIERIEDLPFFIKPGVLESFVGVYQSPEIDMKSEVSLVNGELFFKAQGDIEGKMILREEDEFEVIVSLGGQSVPFQIKGIRGEDGSIEKLILDLFRVNNFRMNKVS